MTKMKIGDKLYCIKAIDSKELEKSGSVVGSYTIGNVYTIIGIVERGNINIFIKGDSENIAPSAFSSIKNPDKSIPYSSLYIFDYFVEWAIIRDRRINEILTD